MVDVAKPSQEIELDGYKFVLEKGKEGYFITTTDPKSSRKLRSEEIYEDMADDFVISNFQKTEVAENKSGVVSLKVFPYKSLIRLHGEVIPAVESGFPVTWSSIWDGNHLNYQLDSPGHNGGGCQAWSAAANDGKQWIQVSALEPKYWSAVTLQGRGDCNQYVTKFVLKSSSGYGWDDVDEGLQIDGCSDKSTKVTYQFKNPVYARTIRICPVSWNEHISLRFEAYFYEA